MCFYIATLPLVVYCICVKCVEVHDVLSGGMECWTVHWGANNTLSERDKLSALSVSMHMCMGICPCVCVCMHI